MFSFVKRFLTIANSADSESGEIIANLAPSESGWIEPAWVGQFPHPLGVQNVTLADLEAIVEDAANQAKKAGANWAGFPIWERHPDDGPALGWIKQVRLQNGRLQLLPEWNAKGRELLANKAYKFTSVSWKCVRDAATGELHPFALDHLGLTNRPNIKGQVPLVNTEDPPGDAAPADSAASAPPSTDSSEISEPASTPAPAAAEQDAAHNAAPEGTPWWTQLTGRAAALVEGADSADAAIGKLTDAIEALCVEQDELRNLRSLIFRQVAQQQGLPSGEIPVFPNSAALEAAVTNTFTAAARAHELETELAQRVLDAAVARGAVGNTDVAKSAALRLIVADRASAETLFNSSAPPALPATPRTPPPDPLRGQRPETLRNAESTLQLAPRPAGLNPEIQAAISNAIAGRQAETGCDYAAAHNWAWREFQAGRINITN